MPLTFNREKTFFFGYPVIRFSMPSSYVLMSRHRGRRGAIRRICAGVRRGRRVFHKQSRRWKPEKLRSLNSRPVIRHRVRCLTWYLDRYTYSGGDYTCGREPGLARGESEVARGSRGTGRLTCAGARRTAGAGTDAAITGMSVDRVLMRDSGVARGGHCSSSGVVICRT